MVCTAPYQFWHHQWKRLVWSGIFNKTAAGSDRENMDALKLRNFCLTGLFGHRFLYLCVEKKFSDSLKCRGTVAPALHFLTTVTTLNDLILYRWWWCAPVCLFSYLCGRWSGCVLWVHVQGWERRFQRGHHHVLLGVLRRSRWLRAGRRLRSPLLLSGLLRQGPHRVPHDQSRLGHPPSHAMMCIDMDITCC